MPWVVGIDEAGYGPNLGPLVQTAVPLLLPEDDLGGWEALRSAVRRVGEADDGRLLIDDSKKVYAGSNGLAKLEHGVFAALDRTAPVEFGHLLYSLSLLGWLGELVQELWFESKEVLPQSCELIGNGQRSERGASAPREARTRGADAPRSLGCKCVAARLVPAPAFNRVVAECGTKGEVLSRGLVDLLAATLSALPPGGEPVVFLCDKLGGRNHYGPLLQQAFPEGWLFTEKESAEESRYRVLDLGREVRVIFRPRADDSCVSVALASMLAKYLREVCMRQFNRFWAQHIPDLKPTAGYPVDAKRFFAAIRPAMEKLGIPDNAVWRVK